MSEQHQWQFRDQTIPIRVCYLLQEGAISTTDLLLSFIITSLTKAQGSQDGKGCQASDAYLAKSVNVCRTHVSARLHRMQKLGLLIICFVHGQRYLEMEWSRTAEERHALAGEYGKAHRKAHRDMLFKLHSKRVSTKHDFTLSTKHDTKYKDDYGRERDVAGLRRPPLFPSGEIQGRASAAPKEEPPLFCYEWNDQAHDILRSKKPPIPMKTVRRDKGAEYFHELWKKLGKDSGHIDRFLRAYRKQIHAIERPIPSSVKQLCNFDVFDWIERQFGKVVRKTEGFDEVDMGNGVKRLKPKHVLVYECESR